MRGSKKEKGASMSRFIKYASNLLDGVDNIAKGSLMDQGNLQRTSTDKCAVDKCTVLSASSAIL